MKPARLLLCLFASASLALPAYAQPAPAEKPAPTSAAKPKEDPLPAKAPKEDYEFVGWCAGVLTGHMALYERVEPTLKEISKRWKTEADDAAAYEAQQKAGRDLLAEFADAMRAAEKASTQAIAPRGARAIALGRDMWASIDTVDDNAKAHSWMNWGLPARCETVAASLKNRSNLMGALLRDNSESAVQTSAVRAVAPRPDASVAKKEAEPKPEPAPAVVAAVKPELAAEAPVAAKPAAATAPTPKPAATKPAAPTAPKPAAKPAPAPATAANPAKAAGLR